MAKIGEGKGFDRIRRITGYLVGTVDRFNNAKKSELNDRVAHASMKSNIKEVKTEQEEK